MAVRNNPFRPLIKQIPAPLRNRYFLVITFFVAWMIFFDKHDVTTQWSLQSTLDELEQEKAYYREEIEGVREEAKVVIRDKEKFARENYYMKKKDEDVYIFVEE
ncbi:MAG: hypothetical protein AAFP19_09415 [Bacteroidota bacterium]